MPLASLQQNEILRENQFNVWSINRGNIVGLFVMVVAFPGAIHYLMNDEFATRETNQGKPVAERM